MTAAKLDLEKVTLAKGGHSSPKQGMCIMEAVSLIAGEKWSDHPECVSPAIGAFLRSWNDGLEDEPRQRLKPYALKVLGTNTGPADEETRGFLALDWLIRVNTPAWLELAGLKDEAAELRNLPALTSTEIVVGVQATLEKARASARTRAAAAWAAARDAAWDAAWAAARDAAWDAARAAAWDAAWDAARDAAWAAAYNAARSVLRPTEQQLTESAFELLDRMIAIGQKSEAQPVA